MKMGQEYTQRCGRYIAPRSCRQTRRMARAAMTYGGLATVVAICAASLGCTSQPETAKTAEPVVIAPPPPPPEPALQVAADAHLTLFGELPDRTRVPFQAQAASPMKQHSFTTEGADFDIDVSPDGKWVVFASTRHTHQPNLYLKTIDGRAVAQLTSDPAADVQPCFSPDGRTIVFASYRSGNWDLWVIGLNGGQATQITNSPLHEVHPSFAPDGKRLAYCMFNDKSDQWELWSLQLDQPGSKRMIGIGLFPEWSPIDDRIVYQKARERGGRWFSIWTVELDNGEPKFPVEVASSADMALIQPNWSPDGNWITYGTALLGTGGELPGNQDATLTQGDIWIVRADGSSPLQLTAGAGAHFGSVWSVDQRVYFTGLENGSENVWSVKPFLGPITKWSTAANDSAAQNSAVEAAAASPVANQGG